MHSTVTLVSSAPAASVSSTMNATESGTEPENRLNIYSNRLHSTGWSGHWMVAVVAAIRNYTGRHF